MDGATKQYDNDEIYARQVNLIQLFDPIFKTHRNI